MSQSVTTEGGSFTSNVVQIAGGYHEHYHFAEDTRNTPIAWPTLKAVCQEKSKYHLDLLRQKYDPDLFVDRDLLHHVRRFMESNDVCYLVLNGQSGMGKTGFLCRLEEHFRQDPAIACLVFDCGALVEVSEVKSEVPLLDRLG